MSPEIWADAILKEMEKGISLQKQINEEYEKVVSVGSAMVRIKPRS